MQWLSTNAPLSMSLQPVVLLCSFPATLTTHLGLARLLFRKRGFSGSLGLTGTGIRQQVLHLTLTGHPRDQTREMKPRPRLAGIWMVSKARDDGLNGKVTGKMCLASMSNWGESFLSLRRTCKDKRVMRSAFGHLTDNNPLPEVIWAYRHVCLQKLCCSTVVTLISSSSTHLPLTVQSGNTYIPCKRKIFGIW